MIGVAICGGLVCAFAAGCCMALAIHRHHKQRLPKSEEAIPPLAMVCGCGRIKGQAGPYMTHCYECMSDLRKERPDWFNADGTYRGMERQPKRDAKGRFTK